MFYAKLLNATYTFPYYLVVIYTNVSPSFLANDYPYSLDTCLSVYKSILFPTNNTSIEAFPLAFTSCSHYYKCSNVYLLYYSIIYLVISYTKSAPIALL